MRHTNDPLPPSDRLLAARDLASRQHGAISREQLLGLGLAARTIDRLVQRGTLAILHRGVYTFNATALLFPGRLRAALLATPCATAVARESAAVLTDLRDPDEAPIHLVTSGPRSPRRQDGVVVRRTTVLPDDHLQQSDGITYTTPARTMLDLAAHYSPSQLYRVIDRAMHHHRFDPVQVHALLNGPNLPGKTCLRTALGRIDETCGRNRSELEIRLIDLIRDSHLPPAMNNVILADEEVDVHFIGTCVVLEADGREWHTSPDQIAADIAKQRRLEAHGFVVVRFDWHAVTRMPDDTVRRAEVVLRRHAPQLYLPG